MKIRLLIALVGLAFSFAVPSIAQEQNSIDPQVRQDIEAALCEAVVAFGGRLAP
jgi:hypothetical protein